MEEKTNEIHTVESLDEMTIHEIKALALSLGYTIKATLKREIIEEFLEQQEG